MTDDTQRSNVLGIVGFVLAFCVSPVGFLVSVFALFKQPRGFAIAGIVVGLLGSVVWAVFIGIGMVFGPNFVKATQATIQFKQIEGEVGNYQRTNGALPPDLGSLSLATGMDQDPWGNTFEYEASPDGSHWTLRSASFDGEFRTGDDLLFEPGMTDNQIEAMIKDAAERYYQQRFGN